MNPEYPYQPQSGSGATPQAGATPPLGATPQSYNYNPQQPGQQTPQQSYTVPGSTLPQPTQVGYAPIPPSNLPPIKKHSSKRFNLWMILAIAFIFTTVAALGVSVWAYVNYRDQKYNTDSKISSATAEAVKEQADKDAASFLEKEKQPNRQFVGPSDYGSLSFDYPKTWSVYEASDSLDGKDYQAYFNPGVVPTVSDEQQYALRLTIQNETYDNVIADYEGYISDGELTSSSMKIGDYDVTRIEGSFSEDIKGVAIIIKIRDKTATIRTDAETFRSDFEALVQTITFVK